METHYALRAVSTGKAVATATIFDDGSAIWNGVEQPLQDVTRAIARWADPLTRHLYTVESHREVTLDYSLMTMHHQRVITGTLTEYPPLSDAWESDTATSAEAYLHSR